MPYTKSEFASRIKAKYPAYQGMDDNELVDRVVAKYPQYKGQIQEDMPAQASPTQTAPAKTNLEGFTEHFGPTALVKSGLEDLQHPIKALGKIPLLIAPGTSVNDFMGLYDAAKNVKPIEFTKGLLPGLAGPIGAIEHTVEGKPGAYGELGGELANVALAGVLPKAGNKLATRWGESTPKTWVEGINPKGNISGLAEKIAPEALERGVGGTAGSINARIQNSLPEAQIALDKAWESVPGDTALDLAATKQALESAIRERTFNGAVQPGAQAEVNALQRQIDFIDEASGGSNTIEAANARRLRQSWDNDVNWLRNAKRMQDLITPEQAAPGQAAETAANAFRESIANTIPETIKPNKDVAFWSNLEKVMENRKVPSNKFVTTLGTIAGSSEGLGGAVKGGAIARLLYGLVNTPAWKTMSAVQKAKIARALGYSSNAANIRTAPQEEPFNLNLQEEPFPIGEGLPENNLWGGDVPPEFAPRESLSPLESMAEREFLRPNFEAGVNADQARMARQFLQERNYTRAQEALDNRPTTPESDFTAPQPDLGYESPVQMLEGELPPQLQALLAEDAQQAAIARKIGEMLQKTKTLKAEPVGNSPARLGPVRKY